MADPNSRDRYFERFDWYLKEHWNPEEPEQTNMIVRHANTRLFLTPPPREHAAVGDLDLLGIETTTAARLPTGGRLWTSTRVIVPPATPVRAATTTSTIAQVSRASMVPRAQTQ